MRWAVADTGSWLEDRRTLVSPLAVTGIDEDERAVSLTLTRRQVETSPPLSRHQPVSRQHELDLHQFYGWPYYWGGVGAWGPVSSPGDLLAMPPPRLEAAEPDGEGDPHLQSSRDVIGHRVEATDGEVGHVEDLLIDDRSWAVAQIVVDTRNWLPGRKVLVAPADVAGIDWAEGRLRVGLTREAVKAGPDRTNATGAG